MTQVIGPNTVMGDFSGVERLIRGKRYRMFRVDEQFWADFPLSDLETGEEIRKRVRLVMTTGSHHMQVYWYAMGRGRGLGMLPLFYLKEQQHPSTGIRSWRNIESALDNHLLPPLGRMSIAEVRRGDLLRIVTNLIAADLVGAVRRRYPAWPGGDDAGLKAASPIRTAPRRS